MANYTLVGQTSIDASTTEYSYRVSLTNPGGALSQVTAFASTATSGAILEQSQVAFGDVAAGGTVVSANALRIRLPNAQSFSSAMLTWSFEARDNVNTFPLVDSGPADSAVGDGIFTGTVVLPAAGKYTAAVTATGNSLSGVAVFRSDLSLT